MEAITRYNLRASNGTTVEVESKEGRYVKYEDVARCMQIAVCMQIINTASAFLIRRGYA